jgi:PAS domain S-box-containing protein
MSGGRIVQASVLLRASARISGSDLARLAAEILALAGVYAIVGRLGLSIAPVHLFASLVWPPTGIALAALLLRGPQLWPGVALGAFVVNASAGAPVLVAAGICVGNTLEALLGAHLICRFGERAWSLDRLRNALVFVAGALLSTAIGATVGVSSLQAGRLVPSVDAGATWLVWWLGDVVGALVVGALLLAWRGWTRRPLHARGTEAALVAALVIAATLFVFLRPTSGPAAGFVEACLLIPLLMWAALRLETRGATLAVFLASAIAIAGTAVGRGPFVAESLSGSLLYLQAFMATVAASVLIVGAVTAERGDALRRAERGDRALREREDELRRITEVTPLMLTRCGRDLRYRFVNRAYARMLGRTPDEIAGARIADVIGAQGYETIRPYVEAVLQGQRVEYEDDVHFAGVGSRTLHVVYVPEGDERGEVVGWMASIVDVTERKQAEEALAESNRRKAEFLGVLSHELRNPLAPIRTAVHVLRRAPRGADGARRAVAVIDRQVNQLARLVDDLLDVTRISRGRIQLRRGRVEVAELVRQAVEDHRAVFEARSIALATRLDPGPLWIDADAARVAQVVGNLLSNAAKFTRAHGHVAVTVERRGDALVAIGVTDDGIGIAPELLPSIFEPFTQADDSLDRSFGGLGLGLALVKALVEMHGGRVEARSQGLGRGAELTVSFPLAAQAGADGAEATAAARRAPAAPRRVLVVEDNVDAAEMLGEILAAAGHEVAIAHDGEAGVARARAFAPDVVICDIGLPGLDGYEVARRIRADGARSPTLIALTGYALPDDRERALEAGFDRHLAKPFELTALEELLASAKPACPATGKAPS